MKPTVNAEPTNREGTIANDVGDKVQHHDLFHEDDRLIVLYRGGDGEDNAVVAMFGYEEGNHEAEGLLDLLVAMAAVLEAHGHDPNILLEAFKDKLPK